MRNPRYTLLAAAAFIALVATLSIGAERTANGQKGGPPVVDTRVVNTAAQPVPVTIQGAATIDASSPIPVRDVGNPDLQPYAASGTVTLPDGDDLGFAGLPPVPQGKRLVIDFVSAAASLQPNQRGNLSIADDGRPWPIAFTQINLVDSVHMTASQPVRIIVNPGADLAIRFTRDGGRSGVAILTVRITGHLVDL